MVEADTLFLQWQSYHPGSIAAMTEAVSRNYYTFIINGERYQTDEINGEWWNGVRLHLDYAKLLWEFEFYHPTDIKSFEIYIRTNNHYDFIDSKFETWYKGLRIYISYNWIEEGRYLIKSFPRNYIPEEQFY